MKRFLFVALASMALAASAQAANPIVLIETSMGNIKVELFEDKAPGTVKNFLAYADDKYYDGTIFHRVMGKENTPNKRDFMIQGGGFESGMKEKKQGLKAPIKNESSNNLSNERYTLAMARLGVDVDGVKAADSASSQFFINVANNKFLDKSEADDGAGYCVFGKVIDGMDVVDKIKAVETGTVMRHGSVPKKDVTIKSIRKVEK